MRGFPLLNLIGAIILLGLMAVPLVKVSQTRGQAPKPTEPDRSIKSTALPTVITLKLVHPVTVAALWKDGRELFTWTHPPGTRLSTKLDLPFFEGAAEFEVRLRWPDGTPRSVAEITVEPEAMPAKTANVWGQGAVEEIVRLTWEGPP